MTVVRTRFAPSPTGYLHIGGARTALYCWLLARHTGGKFILRIEDTDLERSTPESIQAILSAMEWLELDYDEGPYYQTKRFERYHAVISDLLASGNAYRCYCSKERLEVLRATQTEEKLKPRYDGHCRELKLHEEPHTFVVRFKNPLEGKVEFEDLIHGRLSFANSELDDLIIARSDGSPTYNFTVVVDDWEMQITHVIRGDDHLNNTPRQINILRALGAKLPQYAHVPMILGSDGKRLSKRHGAVSVMQYREEGFLPAALLNYLVRLGWSHGDQEIFSKDELIEYFDLHHANKAPAAVNQEKLLWLNQHYLKTIPPQLVAGELAWHMQKLGIETSEGSNLADVVAAQASRCKTLQEMAERSRYFFEPIHLSAEQKSQWTPEMAPMFADFYTHIATLPSWTKESLHEVLVKVAENHDLKLGQLAQFVRLAITGGTVSPPLDVTLFLIGRDRVLERLNINFLVK